VSERRPQRRRPKVEIVETTGNPTDEEKRLLRTAVENIVEAEQRARSSSVWLRSSRSQGRRLGMSDYRDRFSPEDAWRLSVRFPFGGREYQGLIGRGDAK
jgi:hypothetical protein